MNHKSEDMVGVVAPTDSRFRNDVRAHEEGHLDAADRVTAEYSQAQNLRLKELKDNHREQKPYFFREVDHPYKAQLKGIFGPNVRDTIYTLIENEGDNKGYWERRARGDWSDLPSLWGPFDK